MFYFEIIHNRRVRVDVLQQVLTPPATAALTTPESVKLEMGMPNLDEGVFLIDQIDKASRRIATWTERSFGLQQVQQTFRLASFTEKLRLMQLPVTEVVSVVADGNTIDPSTYEIDADRGLIWQLSNDRRVNWVYSKVVVTYWGGWLLPNDIGRTLPADVEQACNEIVRARYAARGRDPGVRSEATEGVGSIAYFDPQSAGGALPASAELLLELYRKIAFF